MNYFLNKKVIKQICGDSSYKLGKKYFEEKRVMLTDYHPSSSIFKATVNSGMLFDVIIKKDKNGYIYTDCTCPKLSSYDKCCQHVAAVLIFLHDVQVNGFPTHNATPYQAASQTSGGITIIPSTYSKQGPDLQTVNHLSPDMLEYISNAPFKGKLFLDRVKNRLLAGLEFQYGSMVINPLEALNRDSSLSSSFIQTREKEQEILKLMQQSLGTKTESGYYWDNEEEEYQFLFHDVPLLKTYVEIFATTAVRDRLFKMNSRPLVKVEIDERTDWLIFQFDMQGVPETEIREVLLSLREKRKYYRLRDGRLLSLESKEFLEMSFFLDQIGKSNAQIYENKISVPLARGLQKMALVSEGAFIKGESFRNLMEKFTNPNELEIPIPESLEHILKKYQKDGFQWLKRLSSYKCGGILADDMGLGKTLQSLAYISSVLTEIRDQRKPVLVVAPSSLIYNWLNEISKFTPEVKATVVHGSKQERRTTLEQISQTDVIITSYPLLRMDIDLYRKKEFHTIFLDEAQAFKNYMTQTAKAVKKIQANYRFALTGTPIENGIEEIWSIFHIVFPDLMPDRTVFRELPREAIARLIAPFMLRRMKENVLRELPEKIESIQTSDLLPEQKKLYAAYLARLKHDALKHLGKDTFQENRIKILAGLTRLRQLCCHPALFVDGYDGSSAKFEQLMEIVKESRYSGKRLLVFSQFTKMLEIIRRELYKRGQIFFYLDGNTQANERIELCHRFNNGEGDLFLISLKAGGTGLNLTGADMVILYDLWWNPAVEQQAADRAYRIGQKKNVQVIKLIAQGTIEERMYELQARKKDLIKEIIQPTHDNLSKMTEEEIRHILAI